MSNLNVEYYQRARLFWRLFAVIVCLSLLYVYFIQSFVFQAVERQKGLAGLSHLQSEIGTLEAEYFRADSQINLDLAYQLGFQDAFGETIFTLLSSR